MLRELGRVDVVCNNAGIIAPRRPLWEHTPDDWRWTLDVNLLGVANGIRAFVPAMIEAGRGHVVNTASMAGLTTIPGGGNGAYSATKHAVVGLSETLRVELDEVAPEVGVTVFCPGPVPSRIHDSARNRPAELADTGPVAVPATTSSMTPLTPVDPAVVGEQVADAVEAGRMYVVTSADVATYARGPDRRRPRRPRRDVPGLRDSTRPRGGDDPGPVRDQRCEKGLGALFSAVKL